jgi:serine/threonine-protein kinase
LYWVRADGTSEPQRLTDSNTNQIPTSWHPSGKFLAYYETRPDTRQDIMILPMEGDETSGWKPGKPTPFLQTPFAEAEPAFSPDGRWIAYLSDESGRGEIYVRPFPGPGGKWQISTAGGVLPTWSKNGREIFFEAFDKKIMVVNYQVEGESFHAGKPQVWSEATIASAGSVRDFDLHPDGQRFAILKAADTQPQKLDKVTFVFNFADVLRKLVPVK